MMGAVDVIAGPTVLLRGRISNGLTSAGLDGVALVIEYRQDGSAWLPLLFEIRIRAGGWYAVGASEQELGARLALARATDFRLSATHSQFQAGMAEVSLSAADMTFAAQNVTVSGKVVVLKRLAGAPLSLDLALLPNPVMLSGRVLSDNQPDAPVAGADVTITGAGGSTVATDANGRFRFDVIPMAQVLTLEITDGARTTNLNHTVDFNQPVNQIDTSLITPPSP